MGTERGRGSAHPEVGEDAELRTLDDEECIVLLRSHCLGRLAFTVDDQPHVFPVNYLFEDKSVVIRTAPGLKLDQAPLRPVAFEIDDASSDGTWGWSVVVEGPCINLTDCVDGWSERLRGLPVQPWAPGARGHWIGVYARRLSGRAFGSERPEPSS